MSGSRKVLYFTCITFCIYFSLSLVGTYLGVHYTPFMRVNVVADVFKMDVNDSITLNKEEAPIAIQQKASYNFSLYRTPHLITNFNIDTNSAALQQFAKKLHLLKTTKKGKVRIAFLGDSMIEGDLMTQTLRELMQQYFGGVGVGFVPLATPGSGIRTTAYSSITGDWQTTNFKSDDKATLFLSGYKYNTNSGSIKITDHSFKDSNAVITKSLLFGYMPTAVAINVNDNALSIYGSNKINKAALLQNNNPQINININNKALDVYGVTFESNDGVFVDNFSFRGISGTEIGKIDSSFLADINKANPYDLIVLQYGVNVLYKPNDVNFNYYGKLMLPVVKKIKQCFPSTDVLIISTADRAFNYAGTYKSAIGIDSLVKLQANIAYQNNCNFYNQFATMGGTNSIVDWANRKPALANKDYVHPNRAGATVLATYFFEALYNDYQKYTQQLNP
ncbi:hypothetical protein ACFOWM_07760 [Ferruginibacter yonginensis]|uniref:Lysophospholipase L1 n=1 Tax=Ferruginibacter yonginensis TaxID=1310416 RepID=A0ABV8QR75_9BACT